MRSGRFRKALSSVPNTNPSCTEIVNQLAAVSPKCHSLRRAGITAEALNQSAMPNSSAKDNSARARHRADGRTGCFGLDFRAVGIDVREREYYRRQRPHMTARVMQTIGLRLCLSRA